ncbi:hypothetical protein Q8W71_01100 [Methylobacterium sp. NEAU 140]|uniref:hypothetical protein n=1 Tax=Methylobacterium sp. NEAU 140 TaxID=3064945 RepID=UPI002735E054|nr:hypothetical protein [Methylobacterium sp. NEAU 140]MDP4021206.1 hypothetical protein [Methylobacterium sp. NEAU 140]
MTRIVQRAALAAGLAGALLACGGARADAPRAPGLACAGPAWALDRSACRPARHAHRRVQTERALAAAGVPLPDAALYGPIPAYGLLILGVGY